MTNVLTVKFNSNTLEIKTPSLISSKESNEKSFLISILDPFKIMVGGIGCVAIGAAGEYERRRGLEGEGSSTRQFFRNVFTSVGMLVRFIGGGLVYCFLDKIIERMLFVQRPWSSGPAGAITALLCCSRSGNGIVWNTGSIVTMALFCQLMAWADYQFWRG